MTAIVATAGAAVLGGAGTVAVKTILRKVAQGAAVLNETLPVNSKYWRDHAKDTGDLVYVAMGDSAAQGIGASRPDRSYVGLLARDIRRLTHRTVRVVNLSVSGATVETAVEVQLPRFVKQHPDVVTVAIGANDIAHFDPVSFERSVATLFDALPPFAIVSDLPYFYLPGNERRVAHANGIVRRLAAERGLRVASLHDATSRTGWRGVFTLFAPDMFHPNDKGYRLWASAFAPILADDVAHRFAIPAADDA